MRRATAIAFGMALFAIGVAMGGTLARGRVAELRPPDVTHARGAAFVDEFVEPSVVAVVTEAPAPTSIEVPAGTPGEKPASTTVLRLVRVVRAEDGAPIADAAVTVIEPEPAPERQLRSDAEGVVPLRLDHDAEIVVRSPGRCSRVERILGIDARRSLPGDETLLEMRPARRLSGRVVDADGAPVRSAIVFAVGGFRCERSRVADLRCCLPGDASEHLGVSDTQGRFGPIVGEVVGSAWFVVITNEQRMVALPGRALDGAPDASIDVELRLPRPVELIVEIVAADGGRVDRHELAVVVERRFDLFAPPRALAPLAFDATARFLLAAAGLHHVELRDGGGQGAVRLATDLVVGPDVTTLRWTLPAARRAEPRGWEPARGTIRGVAACDCSSEKRCREDVNLWKDGELIASEMPWSGDAFELEHLRPGRYQLVAGGREHRFLAPRTVELLPGATVDAGTLAIERRPRRNGRFVDREGRPVDAISFGVVDDLGHPRDSATGRSDASGRFEVARLDGPATLVVLDSSVGVRFHDLPGDAPDGGEFAVGTPRRITGRLLLPEGVDPRQVRVVGRERPEPDDGELLRRVIAEARPAEGVVARDGRFELARITRRACIVEFCCEVFSHEAPIATREAPAGGDVDLGTWTIPAAR